MSRIFVAIARAIFNLLYKVFCLFPRRDEVLFFSRQTNEPSYDFKQLGVEFQKQGYTPVYLVKKLSAKTVIPYIGHVWREIYHLARCRVCFLDRYDPIICMINFKYEPVQGIPEGVHSEFPAEPVVIQLWHAFGAFKKFGYQSLDTREGHTSAVANRFDIHRNYSWIICTGESSRQPFAEAFNYPVDRIVALGRPEYDLLVQRAKELKLQAEKPHRPMFLFAPTLRKSKASQHPFRDLYEKRDEVFRNINADIVWSFHPLEETGIAPGDVNELLEQCDYVVTDYSSIVYEAYLLGKKVLFYVPDIDDYRKTPGLNADPQRLAPEIAYKSEAALTAHIAQFTNNSHEYPESSFSEFLGDVFVSCETDIAVRIAIFSMRMIEGI